MHELLRLVAVLVACLTTVVRHFLESDGRRIGMSALIMNGELCRNILFRASGSPATVERI